MINLPGSSSKTAHIEDEMINLPGSSSKTALFEDEMRGRRGMAGGGRDRACVGINEEVPFSRAGLLVTC